VKHSTLPTNFILQLIAVENLGAFSSLSSDFISALGYKISSVSGEEKKTSTILTPGNYTPKGIKTKI